MAATPDVFKELHDTLKQLTDFIGSNATLIKPVIVSLKPLVPIVDLINKLIDVLGKLKTAVLGLKSVGPIKGLETVATFTKNIAAVLTAAQTLLPNEPGVQEVEDLAKLVTSLPSLSQVIDEITKSIDTIIGQLTDLKS